ncbi:hypothetical protein OEZ85_004429 [Tetradesmus obliquus]|uniref:Uncharacterized protein n=2 Tax=Tetradesmus obliquus TaxID=3088 RepID=A0ABY8UNY8_TETOB|nr:hypothetical protein OEZ85_004429 [Tetradesmus obliquus]|eukprot:jgi/Sobl393_1/5703/SZX62395.1
MELNPSSEEAAAALFNLGCAYAKQRKFKEASEAIGEAINEHSLKISVALKDDDLRELRDTREWLDMMSSVKGGLTREQKVTLRAEAKAPFRLARIILFGGLGLGAAIGLLVILGRLASALKGGEGAPDLTETLTNLGINGAAVAVFGFLVLRDLQSKERDTRVTSREEELGRLLIQLGPKRVLPLIRFRGAVRPVIIAGDRSFVERCIRDGEQRIDQLRARGVSVVPVIYSSREDPEEKLRALKRSMSQQQADAKGFAAAGSAAAAQQGGLQEPGPSGSGIGNSEVSLTDQDRKWRLEPSAVAEWEGWVEAQKEFAGMEKARRNVWMQVQLDGTVRSSGTGTPPWDRFVGDLPTLDSVRTQMTDGIGPSI